jgi:recombination endonuclease VII
MTRRSQLARYGMSEQDMLDLLRLQEGRCAACGRKFSQGRRPNVDHDHGPGGAVRGLLCVRDNHDLLGRFGDDPEFYEAVARYLRNPPASLLPGPPRRHVDAPPVDLHRDAPGCTLA